MGVARLRIATKIKSCPKGFMGVGTASSKLKFKKFMKKNEMVATTNALQTARAVIDSNSEDIEIDIEKELNYDDSEYETTEIDNFILNFNFLL